MPISALAVNVGLFIILLAVFAFTGRMLLPQAMDEPRAEASDVISDHAEVGSGQWMKATAYRVLAWWNEIFAGVFLSATFSNLFSLYYRFESTGTTPIPTQEFQFRAGVIAACSLISLFFINKSGASLFNMVMAVARVGSSNGETDQNSAADDSGGDSREAENSENGEGATSTDNEEGSESTSLTEPDRST